MILLYLSRTSPHLKPLAISNSAVAMICRCLETNFCLVRSRSFRKKKYTCNVDSLYAFHRIENFHSNAIQVDQLCLLGRPALLPTRLNVSCVFPYQLRTDIWEFQVLSTKLYQDILRMYKVIHTIARSYVLFTV